MYEGRLREDLIKILNVRDIEIKELQNKKIKQQKHTSNLYNTISQLKQKLLIIQRNIKAGAVSLSWVETFVDKTLKDFE